MNPYINPFPAVIDLSDIFETLRNATPEPIIQYRDRVELPKLELDDLSIVALHADSNAASYDTAWGTELTLRMVARSLQSAILYPSSLPTARPGKGLLGWWFIEGGNDYTGWGCQDYAYARWAPTFPELWQFALSQEDRERWEGMDEYVHNTFREGI